MNPLTITKNQNLMNDRELRLGYTGTESSWHRQYKDSAWIYVGGLNFDLTEGDIVCVFSQYGEVANLNLVRDKDNGKSKGFAFVCYENQKSTVLAADNLNGIKLGGRIIRVDHVEKYKVPRTGMMRVGKEDADQLPPDDAGEVSVSDFVREYGCGPEVMQKIARLQKAAAEKQKDKAAPSTKPPTPGRQYEVSPPRQLTTKPEQSPPRFQRKSSPTPVRQNKSSRDGSRGRKRSPFSPTRLHGYHNLSNQRSTSPILHKRLNKNSRRFNDYEHDDNSFPSRRKSPFSIDKSRITSTHVEDKGRRLSSQSPPRRSQNDVVYRRRRDDSPSPRTLKRTSQTNFCPSVSPPRRARHLPPPSPPRRKQRSPFS